MPIVFAAVVPHSPLLVPSVAKDHHRLSAQTRDSLDAITQELHARQVDTLIILTPHGPVMPDTFVLSVSDTLVGKLTDFGDPKVLIRAPGAVGFAHQCKEVFEDEEIPVQLQTFDELDYGCTVPLTFVPGPLPRILPVHVGNQSSTLLLRLGQGLYHACHTRRERFGIIASADLVRRDAASPAGKPQALERELAQIVSAVDAARLGSLPAKPDVCGLNPIMGLIATLAPLKTTGTIRSFEVVMRVGLMTATFAIDA